MMCDSDELVWCGLCTIRVAAMQVELLRNGFVQQTI